MAEKERIILGSGQLYGMKFSGSLPEYGAIETDENRFGYIKGGAALEYKPTLYTAKDDLGQVSKTCLQGEDATFKTGIMTRISRNFQKLCSTARVTDDEAKKVRTVKIGGISNFDNTLYLLHFLHKDARDGNIRVTMVGTNQAGFTLNFKADSETIVDAEFKAEAMDGEGTLIIYEEELRNDSEAKGVGGGA